MAADSNDTERAETETSLHKVDIKEEPHENENVEDERNISEPPLVKRTGVSSSKRPTVTDFISAINVVKREAEPNNLSETDQVPTNGRSAAGVTSEAGRTDMVRRLSTDSKSNDCGFDVSLDPKSPRKRAGGLSMAEAASSLVVLSLHQSLNVESLGYSVIENEASERDNFISKDDLKKLADAPEKYSSLGVGHQITSRDKDSDSDTSEGEHSADEEGSWLKCKVCRKVFEDEDQLDSHLRVSQIEKTFKCCACGKNFRDNSQLNVHTRTHTGEQPYECKECGKKFSINGNLSKHMRTHTGERRFHCDVCEKKFTQFAHLEDHVKTHSGDKPYQCDLCMSAFKTKARLKKHVKCHQEEQMTKRSVRCPICDRVMKTMRQLIDHVKSHGDNEEPYHCVVCGKSYRTLFYLQSHQKLHNGIRAFQCSLCDKAFTTSSQLRRHVNSHAGIKPFTCELCDKSFPSTQNLKRHILTHTGIKPYSCDVCSKGFLTLENLNRHMRTHTGEKPYSCDICGKKFAHSTTVKEHRRTHTGDRPYGCSICGRRFTASKMLFRHIRQKHPEYNEHFDKINSMPPNTLMRRTALAQMQQEYFQMMAAQQQEMEQAAVAAAEASRSPSPPTRVKDEPMDTDEEEQEVDEDEDYEAEAADGSSGDDGEARRDDRSHRRTVSHKNRDRSSWAAETVKVEEETEDVAEHCDAPSLTCDICERTFTSVKRLDRHKLCHNNKAKPKKPVKHHRTRRGTGGALKPAISKGNRPFKCGTCAKEFTSERRAENHVVLKHGGKGEIVETTMSRVIVHKVKRPSEPDTEKAIVRSFEIKVENLESEETGDEHKKTYPDLSSITPYPCEVCFKNFTSPEELQEHRKVHGDEKPFRCDVCGECFGHGVTLNEHRWVHTDDSPFQCSFCSEHFVSTKLLQEHLRTQHTIHYELFKNRRAGQCKGTSGNERADLQNDGMSDLTCGVLGQGVKVEAADSFS